MITMNCKPLSVNDAWKGRRYKTDEYKAYENTLLWLLPKIDLPPSPYEIWYEFGMSKSSDIDNPLKTFQDILCKKYDFDDRNIEVVRIKKTVVKKGDEFIKFDIKTYEG